MPTSTYTPLANLTLGSSAASVTFSSISGSYRDLVLVVNSSFSNNSGVQIVLNNDTGANYNGVRAQGNGSAASSDSFSNNGTMALQQINYTANTQQVYVLNLMDYSATDKHKTLLARNNSAGDATAMEAHRWASTAAVTTFKIQAGVGTFNTGSTFALYGIAS